MRPSTDSIALNFFPLADQRFHFLVFRKTFKQGDSRQDADKESLSRYRLPVGSSVGAEGNYADFWVSLQERGDFQAFTCQATTNIPLTNRVLFALLCKRSASTLAATEFHVWGGFQRKVEYRLASFSEGEQCVWLSPYYLASERLFGFLADFHFRRGREVQFDRRVQQLSLSLDASGRENTGSYSDRHQQLTLFLKRYGRTLFPLTAEDGVAITPPPAITSTLQRLSGARLNPKTYVFASDQQAGSQFQGVTTHGPLAAAPADTLLCFIYRPGDKPLSHDLYRALRGDTFPTFPGMEQMFGFPLRREQVAGLPIESFDPKPLRAALENLKTTAAGRPVVPVVLVPWKRFDGPDIADGYYRTKHVFLQEGLPSQFVSLQLLRNKQSLKWSAANIGLGIFAKMGGKPWKVLPRNDRCLIIGIGKSHKTDAGGNVTRYFAYSVLSDSSGLYENLCPLSQSSDEATYLATLTSTLRDLLAAHAHRYEKFTIHTTFALRRKELQAVQAALTAFAASGANAGRLVALKFNDQSDLFGFAEGNNSLVPYESSYIRIAPREYLVWFEGLQYHKPNLRRRVGRPLHVQFTFPPDGSLSEAVMRDYLQDALNLSGANWRGFNAKTLPVSVYYAHLLSRYFGEFDRLGLGLPRLTHLTPWFL